MAKHNKFGEEGEEIACALLREKGYKLIAKNWRFGKLELDIIATFDNMLVIVEVKARAGDYYGDPEDFVTKTKQRHIIKAANEYITAHNIDLETRFDIISILRDEHGTRVEHIESAFYPLV